jgi:putative hydrolase of HD superfamily
MEASGETRFNTVIPPSNTELSPLADVVIRLATLSEGLAKENRQEVDHLDGRPESVAEHSMMLAIIAPVIAERFYPDLDSNLVTRYATIHDVLEAYVGDTPTHSFEDVDFETKTARALEALAKLSGDFSDSPTFVSLINDYEEQKIPEARFVRVLDKLMPLAQNFNNQGLCLSRRYLSADDLLNRRSARNIWLRENYPEFETLITAREELTRLSAATFLN